MSPLVSVIVPETSPVQDKNQTMYRAIKEGKSGTTPSVVTTRRNSCCHGGIPWVRKGLGRDNDKSVGEGSCLVPPTVGCTDTYPGPPLSPLLVVTGDVSSDPLSSSLRKKVPNSKTTHGHNRGKFDTGRHRDTCANSDTYQREDVRLRLGSHYLTDVLDRAA